MMKFWGNPGGIKWQGTGLVQRCIILCNLVIRGNSCNFEKWIGMEAGVCKGGDVF